MRRKGPLVSVIIPVYNNDKYLREAIESALHQTYEPIEIVVVDDGSTDSSGRVAKGFASAVRYIYQDNGGVSSALNRGIEASQGNFLSFLDSDDLWNNEKLMHQMAAFEEIPDTDMVFGHVKEFHSPELDEVQKKSLLIHDDAKPGIMKGCMLVKRYSFFRVGPFDTRWQVGDFLDWYARALEKRLKGSMLDEVVLLRRIHANNMGVRERKSRPDYVRIIKSSLDRRLRAAENEYEEK